jgi:hypothetical protein
MPPSFVSTNRGKSLPMFFERLVNEFCKTAVEIKVRLAKAIRLNGTT